MKNTILLICILIFTENMYCQRTTVTRLNSTIQYSAKGEKMFMTLYKYNLYGDVDSHDGYYWSNNKWRSNIRGVNKYDSYFNLTSVDFYDYNFVSDKYVKRSRQTYIYSKNELVLEEYFERSDENLVKIYTYQYIYEHDERGNVISKEKQEGNGNKWRKIDKTIYQYNQNNDTIFMEYQGEHGVTRYTYGYSNGKLNTTDMFYWVNEWNNTLKTLYEYRNGKMVKEEAYGWSYTLSGHRWSPIYKLVYEYDFNGNRITSERYEMDIKKEEYVKKWKHTYRYNSENLQTYHHYYTVDGDQWKLGYYNIYYYSPYSVFPKE